AERLLTGAEVSMEPVAAHGHRTDHADGFIILPLNQFGLAGFPRPCSQGAGPGVSIAFALEADEHGGRTVGVSFRVAAVFVLSDPKIKAIAGHVRLDAPVTRRTTVIERQLAGNDVGDNIGLSHCEAAHSVRRILFFVFVVVVPRPSTTRYISSYMCFSALSAPAPGTSTT